MNPPCSFPQGKFFYLIEKVTWSKVSWRHLLRVTFPWVFTPNHFFFFFFFFFFVSPTNYVIFHIQESGNFWKFCFISVNLMNIATFLEKFPKNYHKIERETRKKTSTLTFYFSWFVLIL
jgi:hypothetical protein